MTVAGVTVHHGRRCTVLGDRIRRMTQRNTKQLMRYSPIGGNLASSVRASRRSFLIHMRRHGMPQPPRLSKRRVGISNLDVVDEAMVRLSERQPSIQLGHLGD